MHRPADEVIEYLVFAAAHRTTFSDVPNSDKVSDTSPKRGP
jgi:hypothetical protein